jgi:hypothetical protein
MANEEYQATPIPKLAESSVAGNGVSFVPGKNGFSLAIGNSEGYPYASGFSFANEAQQASQSNSSPVYNGPAPTWLPIYVCQNGVSTLIYVWAAASS